MLTTLDSPAVIEHKARCWSKIAIFPQLVGRGSTTECCLNAWYGITRIVWLHDGEKVWKYDYSFRYNTRTWQTDSRMDGQTDRQTPHDGKGRAHAITLSRGTIGIFDQYLASSRVVKVSPSKFENMITRLDTIHERGRQQDGRTDRHRTTAKVAFMHRIARQQSVFRRISCFIACCKCAKLCIGMNVMLAQMLALHESQLTMSKPMPTWVTVLHTSYYWQSDTCWRRYDCSWLSIVWHSSADSQLTVTAMPTNSTRAWLLSPDNNSWLTGVCYSDTIAVARIRSAGVRDQLASQLLAG